MICVYKKLFNKAICHSGRIYFAECTESTKGIRLSILPKRFRRNDKRCFRVGLSPVFFYFFLVSFGPLSFSDSAELHLKTIAVPLFQDNTAEFGIKEELTNELIRAFSEENSLKIADRRSADSILNGTIVAINDQAGSYSRDEQVNEIHAHIFVKIKYEVLVKRKVDWDDNITQFGA